MANTSDAVLIAPEVRQFSYCGAVVGLNQVADSKVLRGVREAHAFTTSMDGCGASYIPYRVSRYDRLPPYRTLHKVGRTTSERLARQN